MAIDQNVAGRAIAVDRSAATDRADVRRARNYGPRVENVLIHLLLLLILFLVLFPVLWIVSMAIDPRSISRPTSLTLIPPAPRSPPSTAS